MSCNLACKILLGVAALMLGWGLFSAREPQKADNPMRPIHFAPSSKPKCEAKGCVWVVAAADWRYCDCAPR